MSRADVYASMKKYLEDYADFPTPEAYLGNVEARMIVYGEEIPLPVIHEMYNDLRRIAVLHPYYLGICGAFSPDVYILIPGAPFLLSDYPTLVGPNATLEELDQDDERRVSLAISRNEEEINQIRGLFFAKREAVLAEPDEKLRSRIASEAQTLGVRWGSCEAKIKSVLIWLERKREERAATEPEEEEEIHFEYLL
ncbi:hypothetical protein L873DRAFT_1842788 [Choiromyces venosus 120613-1]|uniref:Uncharacterized protein n=1 Tax=Choiromyces venosus 120613-1 TaxID=1336337 RepID=A0A3N4JR72_9PEZI|nr:hypothetical protein L873DRAFT_1842788 [Choiromyces venosus 120613-1]